MKSRRFKMKRNQWLSIALATSLLSVWTLAGAKALWQSPPQVSNPAGPSQSVHDSAKNSDSAAIRQAALDYIEGFYEGDGERMERAVHPELAKRIVNINPQNGRASLGQQSAMTLVSNTRARGPNATPMNERRKDVRILDIFGNTAI